jgi:hypothetical protein
MEIKIYISIEEIGGGRYCQLEIMCIAPLLYED